MNSQNTLPFLERKIQSFAQGDLTALPFLYGCFAGNDDRLIERAAGELLLFMDGLSPERVIRFGALFSEYTSMDWFHRWEDLDPARFNFLLSDEEWFAVLAAGSFHPNGYYREKCVRLLAKTGPKAVPYLILRVNDWVRPIRKAALHASTGLLRACSPDEALGCLPYLYQLGLGGRRENETYRALFCLMEERLSSGRGTISITKILALPRKARRVYYEIAFGRGLLSREEFFALLEKEPDPYTRRIAARGLLKSEAGQDTLAFLLAQRDYQLRVLALEHLFEQQGGTWEGYRTFLTDRSQAVREFARFAMSRPGLEPFDFAAFYRSSLSSSDPEGALLGLSETGGPSDGDLAAPFLDDARPRVVKAALIALGRLRGEASSELYYRYLTEGKGSISKAAFRVIQSLKIRYGCARYEKDLRLAGSPALKRRLLALIQSSGCWERLPVLLSLAVGPDETLRAPALACLSRWGYGYLRPSAAQIGQIEDALLRHQSSLPARVVAEISLALKYAKR